MTETKQRRHYQHLQYLTRKYPDSPQEEIVKLEVEASRFRDKRKIARHKRWLWHYCQTRPGLALYLSQKPYQFKMEVFDAMRWQAVKEIREGYEKGSICWLNKELGGSGYGEPLWQSPRRKKHDIEC